MGDTIQAASRRAPGRTPRAWWIVLLLSLLVAYGGAFEPAYQWVAWVSSPPSPS